MSCPPSSLASNGGFTLLEVLATMALLAVGTLAVIALALYGVRITGRVIGQTTGQATAATVLCDARADNRDPFAAASEWTANGAPVPGFAGTYDLTVRGWLNGFYVVRRERSAVADRIDDGKRWADVDVDVFWSEDGHPVASLSQRILRRRP